MQMLNLMTRKLTSGVCSAIFCAIVSALVATSCSGHNGAAKNNEKGDTLTHESAMLTMIQYDGWIRATISDPWSQDKTLATYCLVPRDAEMPSDLPKDASTVVVRTPIRSAVVYSSVYAQGIEDLGYIKTVTGVADAEYFTHGYVREHLDAGDIVNIGNSSSPLMERIVDLSPDVLILSPYEANRNDRVLDKTGVVVVRMVDYMETTPLGRAEWLKLLGAMYGDLDKATAQYDATARKYREISQRMALCDVRPMVLTDTEISGTWYMPGGGSYAARMIDDAGGMVPWSDNASTGSLPCDYAAVYERASEAPVWIMRTFGPITLADLRKANALNGNIKALKVGNVYYTDTSTGTFFDDIAFHPDRILGDYAAMIHPEVVKQPLKYFVKAQ